MLPLKNNDLRIRIFKMCSLHPSSGALLCETCVFISVPTAKILGVSDQYIDGGSSINLTCITSYSPTPPDYLFWYHEGKVRKYIICIKIYRIISITMRTSGLSCVVSLHKEY